MARLEYFVVAQGVSIDQSTNQVSVFNILEDISSEDYPVVLDHCVALALWNAEDGDDGRDFQTVVRVTLPDGNTHDAPANFTMRTPRHRSTLRIQGLPIPSPGEVRFDVELNGQHVASHTLNAHRTVAADGGATTTPME